MHLVFWQPIPSFHQEGFLNTLAQAEWVDSVTLMIECELPKSFQSEGWPVPTLEGVQVECINQSDAPEDSVEHVHIFTGFKTHAKIWAAFNRLPEVKESQVYAYAEAPALFGWRGPLRKMKYQLLAFFLRSKLDGLLAVGDRALGFYRKLLRGAVPVHLFGYYDLPESDFPTSVRIKDNVEVKLLYVGRLIYLKGLDRLFRALAELPVDAPSWSLCLLGNGPERAKLQSLASRLGISDRIQWKKAVPSKEVNAYYEQADYLLQPSRGDGWGMTVVEALRHGCEPVVSDACGAASLCKASLRLPSQQLGAWSSILLKALRRGPTHVDERQANQARSQKCSAESGVKQFREIICGNE